VFVPFAERSHGIAALVATCAIATVTASCATGSHMAPAGASSSLSQRSLHCGSDVLFCPAHLRYRLSFTVAVNGRARELPRDGIPPRFMIPPGGKLLIKVNVTVPMHATVTTLWLGISKDGYGVGPNGPVGVSPILARTRNPLAPGSHLFWLHWVAPATPRRPISLQLIAAWADKQGTTGQTIADLVLSRSQAHLTGQG